MVPVAPSHCGHVPHVPISHCEISRVVGQTFTERRERTSETLLCPETPDRGADTRLVTHRAVFQCSAAHGAGIHRHPDVRPACIAGVHRSAPTQPTDALEQPERTPHQHRTRPYRHSGEEHWPGNRASMSGLSWLSFPSLGGASSHANFKRGQRWDCREFIKISQNEAARRRAVEQLASAHASGKAVPPRRAMRRERSAAERAL